MKKEKKSIGVGIGSSSILVIFVILCLTTFSALSLVSANADLKLTMRTNSAITDCYNADSLAEEKIESIAKFISLDDENDIIASNLESIGVFVESIDNNTNYSFNIKIDDIKTLYVKLDENLSPIIWNVLVEDMADLDDMPLGNLLG